VIEGWYGDDYLILFAESEVASATDRYAISDVIPGYQVLGLRGWDDFILRAPGGKTHLLPTVPIDIEYLSNFAVPEDSATLRSDERFCGKIKWYVKPIMLGGDPSIGENITWVSHEEHAQLVRWWNNTYRSTRALKAKS
jgi:hypothetical protein